MRSLRTLQKGFRRTGNPDLVNDIVLSFGYTERTKFSNLNRVIIIYSMGIIQDSNLKDMDNMTWWCFSVFINMSGPFSQKFWYRIIQALWVSSW